MTILRPDPIIIDLASDTLITCLDSVTIHVILNSATPVTWTNGAGLVLQNGGNNITVPANDPMWYHVNASDIYGCSSSDSVLIWGIGVDINVEIPPPAALCVDSMIQIHSINNNPGDTLVYSWLSSSPSLSIIGANTANPMVKTTVPGAYVISLIVSNQFSCADTINVPITLLPCMNIDDSIDIDRCDGLLVTFTNNSIYDGTWDFGDDSTSTNNPVTHLYAVAGTYTITFTPNASCVQVYTNTIEVIDSLPVKADFGYELVACGDTATYQFYDHTIHTYGIQSHAWTFSPFGSPSSSSEPNPLVSFGQEGTVTVKLLVTDIHGCTDSITTELNVQLNFDSVQDQSFCLGDTVALNPGFHTDYTYQWSAIPNDPSLDATVGNPLVTPQATTIYYVAAHGDCIKLDTALVILNPAAALNLPDDLATCNGTPVSVTAEGNGAGNYIWSTHSNFIPVTNTGATVLLTPLPNGIYYVKFTNLLGCMATDSVAIDNNQVDMAYDPEKIICGVGTVQLEIENLDPLDTLSYNWQGNLPPVSNPMVSPTGTTGYVAVVSNQFGCLDTAFIQVLVSNIAVNANAVAAAEKDRICSGDSTILSVSISGSNNFVVNWFANQEIVGDQEQVTVGPAENTLYTVLVTDVPTGCTAADTLTVYSRACICGSEPYVFVPTATSHRMAMGAMIFLIARLPAQHPFILWYIAVGGENV